MAVSDRAAALAPYLQQLLDDREVQGALRRAAGATRGVVDRARGKSAREAVQDRKLRRRVRQAVAAALEAWSAIDPPPKRKTSWPLLLGMLVVVGVGGVLAVNADAREKLFRMLGSKDASTASDSPDLAAVPDVDVNGG